VSWGQFFLGLVAICVATVVYRWQKAIDRETAVLAEQRQLYAAYLASSKAVYLGQPYIGVGYSPEELDKFFNMSEPEIQNYALRDQIFLLAPDRIIDAVDKHDRALRDWKVSFPKGGFEGEVDKEKLAEVKSHDETLRSAYDEMKDVMRAEVTGHRTVALRSFVKLGTLK